MLGGAIIFLTLMLIETIYITKGTNSTFILIVKIFFYVTLFLFFVLSVTYIIDTAPPIFNESSNLPL